MDVSLYYERFRVDEQIELELQEGERIVSVVQTGLTREVWIEGNRTTAVHRFLGRPEALHVVAP